MRESLMLFRLFFHLLLCIVHWNCHSFSSISRVINGIICLFAIVEISNFGRLVFFLISDNNKETKYLHYLKDHVNTSQWFVVDLFFRYFFLSSHFSLSFVHCVCVKRRLIERVDFAFMFIEVDVVHWASLLVSLQAEREKPINALSLDKITFSERKKVNDVVVWKSKRKPEGISRWMWNSRTKRIEMDVGNLHRTDGERKKKIWEKSHNISDKDERETKMCDSSTKNSFSTNNEQKTTSFLERKKKKKINEKWADQNWKWTINCQMVDNISATPLDIFPFEKKKQPKMSNERRAAEENEMKDGIFKMATAVIFFFFGFLCYQHWKISYLNKNSLISVHKRRRKYFFFRLLSTVYAARFRFVFSSACDSTDNFLSSGKKYGRIQRRTRWRRRRRRTTTMIMMKQKKSSLKHSSVFLKLLWMLSTLKWNRFRSEIRFFFSPTKKRR